MGLRYSALQSAAKKDDQATKDDAGPGDGVRAIFLGPPSSGKGTQAASLATRFSACHLATGNLLRKEVASGSELGKKVGALMERGELVDDAIVNSIVERNLESEMCKNAFILDGYPRTLQQAKLLSSTLDRRKTPLDAVLELQVDDEKLVHRVEGRLIHLPSGRTYHTEFNPPKVPMKDDVTDEPLIRRDDDNAEVLRKRLDDYHQRVRPLRSYYAERSLVHTVDADRPIPDVSASIEELLKKELEKRRNSQLNRDAGTSTALFDAR